MLVQSNNLDYGGQNFYCGIDYHLKTWSVTIETDDVVLKTFTQDADPDKLVGYLRKHYPGGKYIAGYESGYFGFKSQRILQSHNVDCLVIHPGDIPTTHKEKDQKRDPLDSKKIARALRTGMVKSIWIPPLTLEQDRQLLRMRRTLSKDQVRVKNRIKAFVQYNGITYPEEFASKRNPWSKKFVAWLEDVELEEPSGTESLQVMIRNLKFLRTELLEITRKIRKLSSHLRYSEFYSRLIGIPGIGMLTAMIILTEVGDIYRFKNVESFRSFIGLIPSSHSSGEKDYQGRITKRGNTHLRSLLVEATWTAIRVNPFYLQEYGKYVKRMKSNKAIIRVAKKLVNNIYYVLKG